MIYVDKKFRPYLLGNKFCFIVDHYSLSYSVNHSLVTGRVARWIMILLEYDFEVVYVPGKRHIVTDYLSRDTNATNQGIENSFNDTYRQSVAVEISPSPDWLYDYIQYLKQEIIPTGLTSTRKISFVQSTLPYTYIQGQLYHEGPDNETRLCVLAELQLTRHTCTTPL